MHQSLRNELCKNYEWELFRLKGKREFTSNVKPISTSFVESKLYSHGVEASREHISGLPSPSLHGWESVDGKNVPIRCLKPAVPEAVLTLVKCGCKRGCSEERHCVCLRNALPCTNACARNDCENKFLEKADSCNDSDDEEDEEDTEQTA